MYLRKAKPGQDPQRIRILPSFDYSQYQTESFRDSVVPFKSEDLKGNTDWAASVKGYSYFGDLWSHFLSPATLQPGSGFPRRHTDPICDLRQFIYRDFKRQEGSGEVGVDNADGASRPPLPQEYLALIQRGVSKDNLYPVIPAKPRDFVLVNALVETENGDWEFSVVVLSNQCFTLFCSFLETRPGRSDPINSERFPDYLFGDPTSPEDGCILTAREVTTDSNLRALALCPSADNKTLRGYQKLPVSREMLRQRRVLVDPDEVLDIWSYQRILDLLCKDPAIPLELLRIAYDEQVFHPDSVLNEELREEGIEYVAKRNEARAARSAGTASIPEPQIQHTASVRRPSPVVNQPRQAAASFDASSVLHTLNSQHKTNPVKSLGEVGAAKPKPVRLDNLKIESSNAYGENRGGVVLEDEGEAEDQSQSKQSGFPGLTASESEEYSKLAALSQKGAQTMTPDQVNRYIQLMQKINKVG